MAAATPHRRPLACADAREAVSARTDGEPSPLPVSVVDDHLDACEGCRAFAGDLEVVGRRARLVTAAPVPDLSAAVLVALAEERGVRPDRRARDLRAVVAVAGAVQLVLAVPALLGWWVPDVHLGRELGALQLALAVGFLVAAAQPGRAPGVLPIATVVAVAALVTAAVDVAAGAATLTGELVHLAEVVGVVALWGLCRRRPDAPRVRVAEAV